MQPRLNYGSIAPAAVQALRGVEHYVRECGLEAKLLELVRLRASQINGWNRLAISFRSVPGAYQPPACH